ncbi:hypothetical protein UY3_02193 [Chelonia mydas]|uniref:Uncharacterized protein n=1 Tax=Chelonia mydas TaxID=8469 RepID=M7C7Q2_CHEMY|nr:hypothetical protein UY3_02193 [Chelonia mydas]
MVAEDAVVPASSSSSPDKATLGPPPPVPQDDTKVHQELLKRIAINLGLQVEELEEPTDSLFNVLCPVAALPLHEVVAKITNALWQTPSSLSLISKRGEHKYFVPSKGHEYLYTHPAPKSLVVEAVNHREREGQRGNTPKNKDSRRLDLVVRKVYSSCSLQLWVANHQALLGCYVSNMWQAMTKFEGALPEASRKELRVILDEGTTAARAALQAALDTTDTITHTMASAISLHRAS